MKLLLLIFLSANLYAVENVKEKSGHKGYIFDHPQIQDLCQKKSLCEKEAVTECLSKKAKFIRCSEQYKANWIITCQCQ